MMIIIGIIVCSFNRNIWTRGITVDGRRTYFDVVLGKRIAAISLVDYLSHADHVVVVVTDWHAQYQIGLVARHVVDFPIEPRVL